MSGGYRRGRRTSIKLTHYRSLSTLALETLVRAFQYATRPRYVVPNREAADAVEMSVSDVSGNLIQEVRVVAAPGGPGWLIATTNTCGD